MRNERSRQQQVARSGDVIAGLVPEIGQAKQRSMGDEEEGEQEGVGGEILAGGGQRTNCFGHSWVMNDDADGAGNQQRNHIPPQTAAAPK
jgi:hypothetical protein